MIERPTDLDRFPIHGSGRLEWIGVRPARGLPVQVVAPAQVNLAHALIGDRYARGDGQRALILLQAEHLLLLAAWLGRDSLDPALLRRNLMVSGLNLIALKGMQFSIGEVVLVGTGPCDPGGRMEEILGAGALQALRGHGGITASVVRGGLLQIGAVVTPLPKRAAPG